MHMQQYDRLVGTSGALLKRCEERSDFLILPTFFTQGRRVEDTRSSPCSSDCRFEALLTETVPGRHQDLLSGSADAGPAK
jgi:hypothetical protein